jgi:hypothetical protein
VNRIQDESMPEIIGRLRDAFQATADIVQPDEVASFSVRDAAGGTRSRREPPGAGGPERRLARRRALAPLAAAVAVVAVVAGSVAAVRVLTGVPTHGAPAGPGPSARDGLPPFFVTWAPDVPGGSVLAVSDAATGALLSQVYPPQRGDNVMAVAGVGATRTFVIAAGREGSCQTRLYDMRLTAAGRLAGYTPLSVPELPETVYSLAVAPDGSTVAYAGQYCSGRSADDVGVINLARQRVQRWTAAGPEFITSMSLSGDGRLLAYLATPVQRNHATRFLPITGAEPGSAAAQIDLLTTSSPAGSLGGHSRLLLRGASLRPPGLIGQVSITPDGTGLVFGADPIQPSARNGALLWLLGVHDKALSDVIPLRGASEVDMAADPLGHYVIVQYVVGPWTRLARVDLDTGKLTRLRGQDVSRTAPVW